MQYGDSLVDRARRPSIAHQGCGRRSAFALPCALALALAACASPSTKLTRGDAAERAIAPVLRRDVAARASEPAAAAQDLAAARRILGRGASGAAVIALQDLVRREPRYLPAHRLLQDLLIDSPSDWDVRRRYTWSATSTDADAAYLAARIEPDRTRQAELFERALELDPEHPWARVGRALTFLRSGEPVRAESEALAATRLAPRLAMPWLFLGSLHLSQADPNAAFEAYAEAVARDPVEVRGRLGLVSAAREAGNRAAAADAALAALRLAPGDSLVLSMAGEALVDAGVPRTLRAACDVTEAALQDVDRSVALHVLRARLLLASGDAEGSLAACDRAASQGAGHADVARVRRRAAVQLGMYERAVRGFLATAPPGLLDTDSLYAPRWRALVAAAAEADRTRSGAELLALAEALGAVGWRAESAVVFARSEASADASLHSDDTVRRRAARRAGEERSFDRFVDDVAIISRALRNAARRGEDVADVADVLAVIAGASRRRLGRDITAGARVRSYPFLGEFAVSVGSEGAFAREFDSRGLLLLVGRRRGDGTRIVVGRLQMVQAGARSEVVGTELTFDECWLETAGLPRDLAGLGGGLAGLTMDRLVMIQLDAVLRGPAAEMDIPLVPRAAADRNDRVALDTPSAVAARIEARLAAEGRLSADTLETVRRHELGHVLDAQRMLPVFAPPWRALGLVISHGFDGAAVEAHLEARAAVVALADGAAPHAALASLLGFLPETDGATAHAKGYVDVVRRMVEEIESDPEAFPTIRRDQNILQQMGQLSADEAQELGRRVLDDL